MGRHIMQPHAATSYFASDESTPGFRLRELHRGVLDCSRVFSNARTAARYFLGGHQVHPQAPVALIFQLECSLSDADEYGVEETFGPRRAHYATVRRARAAVRAFHDHAAALFAPPDGPPPREWRQLDDVYWERWRVTFAASRYCLDPANRDVTRHVDETGQPLTRVTS